MTFTARILAIMGLIVCGSLQPGRLSGAGRPATVRVLVKTPTRILSIHEVWATSAKTEQLSNIGRRKAIIFSPDLSEPGNREFYRALGFVYFEDPDWRSVLRQIRQHNETNPDNPIETLLIQSHGTNGDALKLQKGNQPDALRSYIAPAALQERLEGTGVRVCLLAACNAGRLFRPENYYMVRKDEGNRLFEPATLGMINASPNFDPAQATLTFARRAESRIEVINECRLAELSPAARAQFAQQGGLGPATRIAIPEMLIQLLLADNSLHLVSSGYEVDRSGAETREGERERLIQRFLRFVDQKAQNSVR